MRIRPGISAGLLVLAIGTTGAIGAGITPVGAAGTPKAELSIIPGEGSLTVEFVAGSVAFPSAVTSYQWSFGDGESATTPTDTVSHTYRKPSRYKPSVVEIAAKGVTASASGTLQVSQCAVGSSQCTESLSNVGKVQLVQATGPVGSNSASVSLFVGPYKISNCEPQVSPAAGLTDSGFTGDLTMTLKYTTTHATQVSTTCFASTVAFVDAAGKKVKSGPLPTCPVASPKVPCVQSITVSGSKVTKVLLIPPGDPRVGAP